MLDKKREKFKNLEKIISEIFSKLPLTPNQYTYLSGVFALVGFYFFVFGKNLALGAIIFFLAGILDMIDGAVARKKGMCTLKGAYLDTIFDRIVEGIIFLSLLFVSLPSLFFPAYIWIYLAMFCSVLVTYSKAASKEKGLTDKEIKGGILSRAERMILIYLILILVGFLNYYSCATYLIVLFVFLAIITVIQRIFMVLRVCS